MKLDLGRRVGYMTHDGLTQRLLRHLGDQLCDQLDPWFDRNQFYQDLSRYLEVRLRWGSFMRGSFTRDRASWPVRKKGKR